MKKYIKSINEKFTMSEPAIKPKTRPTTPATPAFPRPGRPVPTKRPSEREKTKPMGDLVRGAEPMTKPKVPTAPPMSPPKQRPFSPIPKKRPSEREKTKPMGEYKKMMDLFFKSLAMAKSTPDGKKMIKKLHNKYAK